MEIISVRNLTFSYDGSRTMLDRISFSVDRGESVAIIGESGCGKSTLCHILCGMIPEIYGGEISGKVTVGGMDLRSTEFRELAQTVGFVMQDPDRQIVTSAVEDELAFGPENFCIPPDEIRSRVDETLSLLGIEDLRFRNPNRLSGGEKQIVAIGSVLTLKPEIIILDEPYSHLDEENTARLRDTLGKINDAGKTVIMVEHDHELIKDAGRCIMLADGKIQWQGSPTDMIQPGKK